MLAFVGSLFPVNLQQMLAYVASLLPVNLQLLSVFSVPPSVSLFQPAAAAFLAQPLPLFVPQWIALRAPYIHRLHILYTVTCAHTHTEIMGRTILLR